MKYGGNGKTIIKKKLNDLFNEVSFIFVDMINESTAYPKEEPIYGTVVGILLFICIFYWIAQSTAPTT